MPRKTPEQQSENYDKSHELQERWHLCQKIAKQIYESEIATPYLQKLRNYLTRNGLHEGDVLHF